jgi:hypothetical protein
MIDDFESPLLKWYYDGNIGGAVVVDTTDAYTDSGALKLTSPAGVGKIGSCLRTIPFPETYLVGFECAFCMPTGFSGSVVFELDWFDSASIQYAQLRYDKAFNQWYYLNTAGAYIAIPNGAQDLSCWPNHWNRIKFVANFGARTYKHAISQEIFMDLRNFALRRAGIVTTSMIVVRLAVFNNAAGDACSVWFDNVVVTEET